MDVVFEHNPRKKISRETMDLWLNEKGLRREDEKLAYEKTKAMEAQNLDSYPSSIPEKTGHADSV